MQTVSTAAAVISSVPSGAGANDLSFSVGALRSAFSRCSAELKGAAFGLCAETHRSDCHTLLHSLQSPKTGRCLIS